MERAVKSKRGDVKQQRYDKKNNLLRMDNVDLVVEGLKPAIAFFHDVGFELEGEMTVEGPGHLALLRTPDGHGGIELDKFTRPKRSGSGRWTRL